MFRRIIFVLFLLMFVLAACGGAESVESADLVKLRLPMGYIPNIQYAPFYVAAEKGYYAEAGFEIDFDYSFETDGVALTGAGEVPFAIVSAEQVLLAREQGIPVVYVMAWFQDFPVAVIAKAEMGIENPADLTGQEIGLPGLFGANYIGLRALLNAGGVAESDATLNSIGFNQIEALLGGQTDIIVGYTNNEPIQLAAQGVAVTVMPVSDYVHLPANGLITNETQLAENPELVARFVAATLRGLADVIADPDGAYDVSLGYVEGLAEVDANVQMDVLLSSIAFWQADVLGYTDQAAWENMQTVLLDMGLLGAAQDLGAAFTNEFVE